MRTTITHRKPASVRVDEATNYEVYRHPNFSEGTYVVPLQTYTSTPKGERRTVLVVGGGESTHEMGLDIDEMLYPVTGAQAVLQVNIPTD